MDDLRTYFLPTLPIGQLLRLQRRLAFEIGEAPGSGALLISDHPPCITIGRDGSRLDRRGCRLPARWAARGGGTLLHAPGQVSLFPIMKLTTTPAAYRDKLQDIVASVVEHYSIAPRLDPAHPGIFVGDRLLAHVGIAIRSGVTAFGITLNVNPNLELFREVRVDGLEVPMTSLERESPMRVRLPAVRQQLAEAVAAGFGFAGLTVFHHHPHRV